MPDVSNRVHRASGESASDGDGMVRHLFERYLWSHDAIFHISHDLHAFFSELFGFSWLPGLPDAGGAAAISLSPALVALALVLAGPRLVAHTWRLLRVALLNRPGTVLVGYARREGSWLKRLWLASRPIFQHVSDRLRVYRFVGSIGSGKTTAMLHYVRQDLRARLPVVIIEMSGDLGGRAREYSRLYGTTCYHFDPADRSAYKLNPLAGPDKEKIAMRFVDVVCGDYATKEQYFKQHNEVLSYHGVIAVKCYEDDHLGGEANIRHLIDFITKEDYRKKVLLTGKDEKSGRITVNAPWLDGSTRDFYENVFYNYWTPDQRRAHTVGMTNALLAVTAGTEFREALCPKPGERRIRLEQAIEEGALVLLRSPVDVAGAESAATLAGWLLGSFEQVTESRQGRRFVSLYLDEAHLILSQSNYLVAQRFKTWIPLVRHHRVMVAFAYQSFSMLEYGLGQMLSTIARNTLVFGAGLGYEDAEEAAKVAGNAETEVHDHRRTRRRFIPLRLLSSLDESDMVGTRTELRPRYGADEIRAMKPGHAVATLSRNNRTGRPVEVRIPRERWAHRMLHRAEAELRRRRQRAERVLRAAAAAALTEAIRQGGARPADTRAAREETSDGPKGQL